MTDRPRGPRMSGFSATFLQSSDHPRMTPVRRFQQTINGRVYHIEASRVRDNRWRAQIARVPGMPTALMPFYGKTADEAARCLTDWLARANRTVGVA